jgi:RNA polymerase sigma factor (sigma-70 family)
MKPDELYLDDFRCKDEAEAWLAMKSGDKRALIFFYTRYFNSLYNYGTRITKDAALAEDCIQDLFTEFWSKHDVLREVKNIKSYLFKSLRRKIVYKLSRDSKFISSDRLPSFEIELSHKTHYLSQQIEIDVRKKIADLILSLTPKQREAIFLIYYEELSYEEAAHVMDLKVKTIYNLIHLAISKLRESKTQLSLHVLSILL